MHRMLLRGASCVVAIGGLLTLAVPSAGGQVAEQRPVRVTVGGSLLAAQPLGEFKDYVNSGFGGGGHVLLRLDPQGFFALRGDLGYLIYGHERQRISLAGAGRVQLDVRTTNNILTYSAGPQLMIPRGSVRPYINAFIGGAYFYTQSSVAGSDDYNDFASTRNFSDNVASYGVSGGIFMPFRVRNAIIGLDLGARFIRNGETRYLREGGITDLPAGGYTVAPIVSETNLAVYNVGVRVGLRSRRR